MTEPSDDYHDYVFRDGKLVGNFEGMYRNSSGVPWHQDEQATWIDVRLTIELFGTQRFDEIHDLSCGLGYYLDLMCRRVGAPGCRGFGYDIAPTAVERAGQLFPGHAFQHLDLTAPQDGARQAMARGRRLFVLRATLWYVFPTLSTVIETIKALMTANDTLCVVQNFPPLDKPFVGKDTIPDPATLIRIFSNAFRPIRHLSYEDRLKNANDNWTIAVFTLKEAQ